MEFCDLNKQYLAYKSEMDSAIQNVIDSSAFINGAEIELLENELSSYVGVKHAITCSSGTDALLLALMAYDVQPGDEVICPAFSFIASASMVSFYKAKPVFVDVSPTDFNMDVTKIEDRITKRTKGIIVVSLFGQCPDMDAVNSIAAKYGLWVIEDGAQSFGSTYHGKKSGALTDLAVTSFFPAKPLGCYGDGGAIFTNNSDLSAKMKILRSHGQVQRYYHRMVGINGRIDTIQAAVLRVKLNHFDDEILNRQKAAALYSEMLKGSVLLPEIAEGRTSTWAQYTICVEGRDQLRKNLEKCGIPTAVHYPVPLPAQLAFSNLPSYDERFEVSELLSETVLSLPMYGFISEEEVKIVAETIIQTI